MPYTPASQVVERQLDYFVDRRVLIAGEIEDNFAGELINVAASVSVFTTHFGRYSELNQNTQLTCHFGDQFIGDETIDMVLLYWPKAKAEANYLLAMLMAKLGEGIEICVVGENRNGVRSAENLFEPYGNLIKYDSARRCSFYWGKCTHSPAKFDQKSWLRQYPITLNDTTLTIYSLPGVFSHGELDLGSQLLLESLPTLTGKVLDFGCGAGVIGAFMKKRNPTIDVTLTDISALAIASAKLTFEANGLTATICPSDVYSALTSKFDALISNPPFHSGRKTFYAATENWIKQAPQHLTPTGKMILVANRFLPYPDLIEATFGHCECPAKNNKFSVYAA